MRYYEIVILFRQGQKEQVEKLITNYQKLITDSKGTIDRFEDWGRLPLAYPINEEKTAKYILMNVQCSIEILDKLKETMKFNDFILRHLIIKKDKAETNETLMMKQIAEQNSKS